MRILFFNFEFPPIGGGGANANAYLFREFSMLPDLQIDCVTSATGGSDELVAFSPNINLYRLAVGKKDIHYWTQKEILTYLWRAHRLAGELLRRNRYDLCHAFFGFPSGVLAWARRDRLPYLISLRGSDVPGFNPRTSLPYVALKPLFRRIWHQAESVIANSLGLRQLAERFESGLAIKVVPNGIDTGEFTPATSGEQQEGLIICVSRLVERKGVQHLIDAMPTVCAARPAARLLIVGEGDLEPQLRSRCLEMGMQDKITFLGYVPHEELPPLYRRAELYVQPSFYEGMSNTVLEAMASGLPVVATGEGGREELYRENAVIIPYSDSSALAEALVGMLGNSDQRGRMGEVSREIAEEFSWKVVADRYLEEYRHLMRKART